MARRGSLFVVFPVSVTSRPHETIPTASRQQHMLPRLAAHNPRTGVLHPPRHRCRRLADELHLRCAVHQNRRRPGIAAGLRPDAACRGSIVGVEGGVVPDRINPSLSRSSSVNGRRPPLGACNSLSQPPLRLGTKVVKTSRRWRRMGSLTSRSPAAGRSTNQPACRFQSTAR